MANEKLSQLPSGASTLTVADLLYLAQSGASVSITIGDIPAAFALASAASPAAGTFTALTTTGSTTILCNLYVFNGGGISNANDGSRLTVANGGIAVHGNGTGGTITAFSVGSITAVAGASVIGSLNGVMAAINDGESAALPITRLVGTGTNSVPSSVGNNTVSSVGITITGALATDAFVVSFNGTIPQSAAGALVVQAVRFDPGLSIVTIDFYNTDQLNASGTTTTQVKVNVIR